MVFAQADALGRHDLVGGGILQHAVLVDAAFMGEGVAADDRLVGLHGKPVIAETQPRGAGEQLGRLTPVGTAARRGACAAP